jgi:hypothetical protein
MIENQAPYWTDPTEQPSFKRSAQPNATDSVSGANTNALPDAAGAGIPMTAGATPAASNAPAIEETWTPLPLWISCAPGRPPDGRSAGASEARSNDHYNRSSNPPSPGHIQLQFIANNLFTRLAAEVVIIPNSAVLVLTPTTEIELDHGCWVLARFAPHPNQPAGEAFQAVYIPPEHA